MPERVQKILSQWGIASRRQAEQMILDGRVTLNGAIAELGQKADPIHDRVEVDGNLIQTVDRPQLIYLLLNKPAGIISTCDDPHDRRTVLELLPKFLRQGQGIHPIGRLDVESTGAILLTNDGELTHYLTHPRHHIPKTYEVWVDGEVSRSVLQHWREGVMLDDRKTLPASVDILRRTPLSTLLRVILREGRNRQIRRVAEQLGHPVIQLHRSAIGEIRLDPPGRPALLPGQHRPLEDFEIRVLQQGINPSLEKMPAQTKEQRR
ncbi:MAG: rRNA pseudouridine synthase [Plectolyngbya sp. WJT66-NPBG17]|jgi:23S rRNA pseudouridine2605 synthase|nr:rRNA pseudouridine synthase [Plectolyngbya sp. WJT66-NPBG17]